MCSRIALLLTLCGFDSISLFLSDSPWKVHLSNVSPEMTSVTVSGLTPARTYQFRVCAVNQVGKGQYSAETNRCVDVDAPLRAVLGGHTAWLTLALQRVGSSGSCAGILART